MPPFSESRNFRGWWVSKTGLEQKLIILTGVLFILSFCLLISVIVIAGKKSSCGETTTPSPTESTVPTGDSSPTTSAEPASPTSPTASPEATTATDETPPPTQEPKSSAATSNTDKTTPSQPDQKDNSKPTETPATTEGKEEVSDTKKERLFNDANNFESKRKSNLHLAQLHISSENKKTLLIDSLNNSHKA